MKIRYCSKLAVADPPLVSAVMALHNGAATVRDAVRSIQSQTYPHWELIIVDDASTDGGLNQIEILADPRIRTVRLTQNQGSGHARNVAMSMAKGDLIAPADADDLSLPHRFAKEVDLLSKMPDAVAVSGQLASFGDWGGPEVLIRYPTSPEQISARFQRRRMGLAHCASMFRRQPALEVGGYDECCLRCQDFALFLKLSDKSMYSSDETLVLYRSGRQPTLRYWLSNSRYGRLANRRNAPGGLVRSDITQTPGFPFSLFFVLIDTTAWVLDRWRARRDGRVLR